MSAKPFKTLRILKQNVVFQFVEETTADGLFKQRSKGGLIVMESKQTQVDKPRWGKVICVGEEIESNLKPGDFIYIKSLQWTPHFLYDDEKLWTTDIDQIIAVTDVEPPIGT